LFAKYGVTAVISGHSHNNELLVIPDVAYDTGTADVVQIVSGTGGHSLRAFHDPVSPYQVWGDTSNYAALRLDADRLSATFQWIAIDGTVLHTYTFDTPRENSGVCYIGDAAKEIFTLEVRPAEASVEVGGSWPYRAFANYLDGTVEDVTTECTWSSSDDTVGVVGTTTGVAVGFSPGVATITAELDGESDTAEFHVLHSCVDEPTEIVFCLSRATSMGGYSGGSTRLEAVKDAVSATIDAFDSDIDKVGLISFAGTFLTQTEDSTLDSVLTDDFASVKDALSLLVPDGAVGIPSGLDTALGELTGARHVDGSLRAVVLVVDWPANVVDPGGVSTSQAAAITAAMAAATTSADAIKALSDTTLVVFGVNIPSTYRTALQSLATNGYYFDTSSAEELLTQMAQLPHILCFYNGDYYYYPPVSDCGSPVPDYQELFDWDVIRGTVDLAGIGPGGNTSLVAWDPRPGNGMYLDMIGTNPDFSPDHDTTCGKIRTKESYPFEAGKTYKLSLSICNYVPSLRYIDVSIGNSGEVVAPTRYTPANADFVTEEITWVQASDADAPIIIDSEIVAPTSIPGGGTSWPAQGVLVNWVLLENVTDAVEMFSNDFDGENPCEL
jgi:hypothetical protein